MIDENFFGEIKSVRVSKLAGFCGFKIIGGKDFCISGIATLREAICSNLSFYGNKKYLADLKATIAGAVIIAENDISNLPEATMGLIYPNVMVGYAKALNVLYPRKEHKLRICATAIIHESAKLGIGCSIGEYVIIEENVVIGDDVTIGHGCVI